MRLWSTDSTKHRSLATAPGVWAKRGMPALAQEINGRVVAAGAIGNILEWYDFAVYGYLAPIIALQFFPTGDPLTSLIAAFGVFAAGYFMRPLGALLIGHIGDRAGRKAALTLSIALMAIPTGLMALVPTYATAGIAAPVMLTALRLLQGVSVGGEYTGSGVFLVERAAKRNRGLIGSLCFTSGVGGALLASAVVAIMSSLVSTETFSDWGWRLAFVPGPILGIAGYFLRRRIQETDRVAETDERILVPIPISEALRNHRPGMLRVGAMAATAGVTYYTAFVFLTTYLTDTIKLPEAEVLELNTAAMGVLVILLPVFAWISDGVGRKPVMFIGIAGTALMAVPLFLFLHSGDWLMEMVGDFTFAILVAAFGGPMMAMMSELFPRRVRYTAVSVAYSLPIGFIGGTTPMVVTWLIATTGNDFSPAYYLAAFAVIGAIAVLKTDETKDLVID
jgi:MHS family proline/betaine transporter-like MFS transporter